MARKKKNTPEQLAKIGILLAGVGALCFLALAVCAFRNFNFGEFTAQYMAGGWRYYAILGSTAVGAIATISGWFLSLHSAGQPRNELAPLAWKAFIANTILGTLTLCVFIMFWFARDSISPPQ